MDVVNLFRLFVLFVIVHIVIGLVPGVVFYKKFWSIQGKRFFDRMIDNFLFYLGFAWQISILLTVVVWIYFHLQFMKGLISYVDVISTTLLYIVLTVILIFVGHFFSFEQKEFEEG